MVCGRDFNSIRNSSERQGRCLANWSNEINEFNYFIDLMELVEVPAIGNEFTWANNDGSAKSRLDRFLLLIELIEDCGAESGGVGYLRSCTHLDQGN